MIKVPISPEADPKNANTVFRTVVDPSEMEELILKRNRQHFRQADKTPLVSQRLSKALGWGADSSTSELILTGQAQIPDLTNDPYAQDILAECKRINAEIDPSISIEQIQRYYLQWRVGTSTAPSGRHLSHIHALFHPFGLKDDTVDMYEDF